MSVLYGDGHVHLYPQFDLARLFGAALARSRGRGAPLLLLLAECQGDRVFPELARPAQAPRRDRLSALRLRATGEAHSLALGDASGRAGSVFLIAGRQLVSREGLEVLALALNPADPLFEQRDGERAAAELIERALAAGAAVALPWGVGKWLGARGRLVGELVRSEPFARHPLCFVGDIAHRTWPWPRPAPFRGSARVLPGTDLLPLPGLEERIAGYGFRLEGEFAPARPAASLLALLAARAPLAPAGRRASVGAMLREQLQLRVRGETARAAPAGGAA